MQCLLLFKTQLFAYCIFILRSDTTVTIIVGLQVFRGQKSENLSGPIAAKNAKFAVAIIAIQKKPNTRFRFKTKTSFTF